MILVDGQELKFSKGNLVKDSLVKIITEEIDKLGFGELGDSKRTIKIIYPPQFHHKDLLNEGKIIKKGMYGIPLTVITSNWGDGMQHEITYCDKIKKNGKDEKDTPILKNGKREFQFKGLSIFNRSQKDLAWYLIYASGYLGKAFIIDDVVANNKNKAEQLKGKRLLISSIYEDIPIEDLRKVAEAYNVGGVDEMSEEQLQNTMYEKVENDKGGYDKFIDMASEHRKEEVDILANIQTLLDNKIVYLLESAGEKFWYTKVDGVDKKLVKIRSTKKDNQALVEYLTDTPSIRNDLFGLIK